MLPRRLRTRTHVRWTSGVCLALLFSGLLSLPALAADTPVQLLSRTCGTLDGRTRVAFTFDRTARFHYFSLNHPSRLVLDFSDARPEHVAHGTAAGCGRVKRVWWAERNGGVLRYVLALEPGTPTRVVASPAAATGHFLVVARAGAPGRAAAVQPARGDASGAVISLRDSRGPIVVAIDPGHGGSDPGTHGPHGLDEKTVTLDIARALARRIDETPGMMAFLTRRRDRYVSLRRRVLEAQDHHADLFVSIHANAFPRVPAVEGGAVYTLSLHGASSAEAKLVARTENAADPVVGNVTFAPHNRLVNSALVQLAQQGSITAATELGRDVLRCLARVEPLYERHVQFANFDVLRDPVIPSILVETAFLSNPTQAREMHHASFRDELADAIYRGIREYTNAHDVAASGIVRMAGQDLASRPTASTAGPRDAGSRRYTVKSGDTLSGIAVKFGLSQWRLEVYNHLHGAALRAGQTLRLPPSSFSYRVRPGDSLSVIAEKAGVSVRELQTLNDLNGTRLEAGERLELPPVGGA